MRAWRSHQHKRKKKGQNELAISSRTRPVTRLAGPSTSRVHPSVCSLHPAKKGRPTSLVRGEGLAAAVPSRRERGEAGRGGGGGGREERTERRNGNRSSMTRSRGKFAIPRGFRSKSAHLFTQVLLLMESLWNGEAASSRFDHLISFD